MSAEVLSVGLAGELPLRNEHAPLAARASDPRSLPPLVLPPVLRRERKVRVIVEAAHRALAPLKLDPAALARCALVVVTRYAGQAANKIDPATKTIISFADMAPTTVAFTFVSHMASSCVPALLKVSGPSVTLGSREGLAAGLRVAERWLGRLADRALVIETDLALPSGVVSEHPVPSDYGLAVVIGKGEPE